MPGLILETLGVALDGRRKNRVAARTQDPEIARRLARNLWFAVQRMTRRRLQPPESPAWRPTDPDDLPDDGSSPFGSGVPLRPAPSSGSAVGEVDEPRN